MSKRSETALNIGHDSFITIKKQNYIPMEKIIKSFFEIKTLSITAIIGLILVISGCNKDFENVLPKSFRNDTLGLGDGSKKVLYIIMDGVKGSVVESLAPTNITEITQKAIYSYDGLADFQYNQLTNAAAWTTMLTGVDYTKHQVSNENFSGLNLQATPTIFTRIKESLGNVRSVSIAASAGFNDNLAVDASMKQTLTDDAAVKAAVVDELSTNNPSLVVAQFHSAEDAGATAGYTTATPSYTTAIQNIDGYIGEILKALKARKTYATENWLVVIASNKGGGTSGGAGGSNIYDDLSRNTFLAFYNPKFVVTPISQPDIDNLPYVGTAPRFASNASVSPKALLSSNTNIGNFGVSGNFTMMFKMKDDLGAASGFPPFIAKQVTFGSGAGWNYFRGSNNVQLSFSGASTLQGAAVMNDSKWHTYAITITTSGGTRTTVFYIDGVSRSSTNIGVTNRDNTAPLRIGADMGKNTSFMVKDLAIFNVAMTPAEVIKNMRIQLRPSNPFFSNLLGYWPFDETSGTVAADVSGKGNNMTYSGPVQFIPFSEISPNISPEISSAAYTAVPNGVDIPVLIYNWLNIAVPSQWGLMGKFYNPTVTLPKN
ncbi:Type I phosphodiesterase / nucleotide pyrophosphatase [Pedobacter nyackensis]|uniref:Type I phosphodiesterase / nucleotide pyrophosphatase n=2 Tax=Pedobacter nyackensis TaxID=475255 RepID=A0A1W2AG49_9SPHI|nr:Type I phosphodiesterase / nucleotide pyrophosphatase [Pedobacter nyackensis]